MSGETALHINAKQAQQLVEGSINPLPQAQFYDQDLDLTPPVAPSANFEPDTLSGEGQPPLQSLGESSVQNTLHTLTPRALEADEGQTQAVADLAPEPSDFIDQTNQNGEALQPTRLQRAAAKLGSFSLRGVVQRVRSKFHREQGAVATNEEEPVSASIEETELPSSAAPTTLENTIRVLAQNRLGDSVSPTEANEARITGLKAWRELAADKSPEERRRLRRSLEADFEAELVAHESDAVTKQIAQILKRHGHGNLAESVPAQLNSARATLAQLESAGGSFEGKNDLLNKARARYEALREVRLSLIDDPAERAEQAKLEDQALLKASGRRAFPKPAEAEPLSQEAIQVKQELDQARRVSKIVNRIPAHEEGLPSPEEAGATYRGLRARWQNLRQRHPAYRSLSDKRADARQNLEELRSEAAYRYLTGGEDAIGEYEQFIKHALDSIPESRRAAQQQREAALFNQERQAYAALLKISPPNRVRPAPDSHTTSLAA